jgi:hypothetical protein
MGIDMVGFPVHDHIEFTEGGSELALLFIDETQVEQGIDPFRIDLERILELNAGLHIVTVLIKVFSAFKILLLALLGPATRNENEKRE